MTTRDANTAQPLVEEKLHGSFFRVRTDRTTDLELAYLRAMAELGPDPQIAGDPTPGYGLAAFTVPQFDRYMTRNHPLTTTPPKKYRRR